MRNKKLIGTESVRIDGTWRIIPMSIYSDLSYEQKVELRKFAADHGRAWRGTLAAWWSDGRDASNPLLRQIRNKIGPSGLWNIKTREMDADGYFKVQS